ncbi:MAG: hypothetical protein C0615_04465 [Desulfuromonas sp.]|nr:MAG: hypothetical protein C0615_04465 [Desulfuromonas sp.]
MTKQKIDSTSRIRLPSQVAAAVGNRELEISSFSTGHILFSVNGDGKPLFAGCLGDVTVTDLLSFCNMFRKSGALRFALKGGQKEFFFDEGEIVFATSSFPQDDISEVLYELGKINHETLKKIREVGKAAAPAGKVLVEKGMVSPKDLWLATRQQVEAIIYSLFTFAEGDFVLFDQGVGKEESVRLAMSTQNMIMEGLRRVDEKALYLREIPSFEVIPVLGNQRGQKLTEGEQKIVELIREESSNVRELIRRSGFGEFDGLRNVYQLLRKKVISLEEPIVVEVEGELGELLAVFNGALTVMSRQIATVNTAFVDEVRVFIRDLPQPYSYVFRDVTVADNGSVDGSRIMANLDGLEEGDKKRLLADALSEVVYMECISAKENLPAEESAELIKRVQKISERIKSLIGRSEG